MRLLNFGWAAIDYADSLPFLCSSHRQAASPFDSCLISIIWRVSSSARGLCQGRVRQVKTNPTHTHPHTNSHTHTLRFWQKIVRFSTKFWINHGGDMSSSAASASFCASFCDTRQLHFKIRFFPSFSHFISLCCCRCLMCRRESGRELTAEQPNRNYLNIKRYVRQWTDALWPHNNLARARARPRAPPPTLPGEWGWGCCNVQPELRLGSPERESELNVIPKVLPLIDNWQLHQLLFAFHFSQWSQFPNAFPPLLNKAFWDSSLLGGGGEFPGKNNQLKYEEDIEKRHL